MVAGRPCVCPNKGFVKQLKGFGEDLGINEWKGTIWVQYYSDIDIIFILSAFWIYNETIKRILLA